MSGVGQDLRDDPIELLLTWLLTLVWTMHITAAASLQPTCPTEQMPEVKPWNTDQIEIG